MKRNLKIYLSWLLILSMTLSFAGCGKSQGKENGNEPEEEYEETYEMQCLNLMDGVLASEDALAKEGDADFFDTQMRFALELFRKSVSESENQNVLVSPLSVMLSLSMTANGASEETRNEMEQVLGSGIAMEDLNAYLKGYAKKLTENGKVKFQIANSIWLKDTPNFIANPDFLQIVADYYGADVFKAPFDDTTLSDINYWVKENTDGMIEKMLDELGENSIMYLINTLLFDAEWSKPYTKGRVRDDTFYNISGVRTTVPMMRSGESVYLGDKTTIGFMKSYKGGKFKFAVLVPKMAGDIYDYIDRLNAEKLQSLLENKEICHVDATLPKFSYDYSIEMSKILSDMGLSSAFGENANFSALGSSSVEGPTHIEKVLHKSFITVDTIGTKAGVATVSEVLTEDAAMDPKTVKVNRPFIYMIIDAETNLPIFMGAVVELK